MVPGTCLARARHHLTGPSAERLALLRRISAEEFVAETVDGDDEFRRLRVGLELLPQAGDVDVDGARQRHLVVAPYCRQERVARQHGASMLDEVAEQLELTRRQLHRLA